ncbi:MAG: DMT family transporter [Pseudobdellovibrio sp.]
MGVLFIVLATIFWSLDTLIRYPLLFSGVQASQIVFIEHLILVLIFLIFIFIKKQKVDFLKKHFFSFLIIGCCGSALGTLAFTQAFSIVNPSLVIVLQKLQPIVAIILARLVLNETIPKHFLKLGLLSIFGALLISWTDLINSINLFQNSKNLMNQSQLFGYGLVVLSVVSWGASTVFGKKLDREKLSVEQIMFGRFFYGLIALVLLIFLSADQTWSLDFNHVSKIFLMVLLSGLIGMYFYYKGVQSLSARVVALAELFFPVSAILINWIFLNKPINTIQIVGALILLTSTTILQFNNNR